MSPVLLTLVALLVLRAIGAAGVESFSSWQESTRFALALTFIATGAAHFTRLRHDLARIVPSRFPKARLLVSVAGLWQLAGGIALLFIPVSRIAAYALIALLLLKLPINVNAARARLALEGRLATPPWLRVPLQGLWMILLWWSVSAS